MWKLRDMLGNERTRPISHHCYNDSYVYYVVLLLYEGTQRHRTNISFHFCLDLCIKICIFFLERSAEYRMPWTQRVTHTNLRAPSNRCTGCTSPTHFGFQQHSTLSWGSLDRLGRASSPFSECGLFPGA